TKGIYLHIKIFARAHYVGHANFRN